MRGLSLVACCGLLASIAVSAPQAVRAQQPAQAQQTNAKTCRMEQQCHWQDFKKVCVWVKVCR
jgi:hypothetical protein